jgi:hypothetical protein
MLTDAQIKRMSRPICESHMPPHGRIWGQRLEPSGFELFLGLYRSTRYGPVCIPSCIHLKIQTCGIQGPTALGRAVFGPVLFQKTSGRATVVWKTGTRD